MISPTVVPFFDNDTSTFSYLVFDPTTHVAMVVDPVFDFDYPSSTISTQSAQKIIDYVRAEALKVEWIVETHVHADHLSSAQFLKSELGGKIAISERISAVQHTFATVYNESTSFLRDGSQFDYLFKDQEEFDLGEIKVKAVATPGHTPACMSYIAGNCVLVGDTLFMPESGTARSDFPGGSAEDLYESVQTILSLPDNTKLYMCHDYSADAENNYQTTVGEQKLRNIHVNSNMSKDEFIRLRTARDASLGSPRYLYPSIQVNMRAGHLPDPDLNQRRYFKIPINKA